jgi:hypothetical protein
LFGVIVVISPFPTAPAFADSYFFDDIDKSLLSIGGRGTYFDPNDTSPKWYGGAQVRLHLGQVFAIEGSVDYREKKFDSTFTRTFPVQVSGLIYLLPGKRISPFLLGGGGWYYTQVKGPGDFDATPRTASVFMPAEACSGCSVTIGPSMGRIAISGSRNYSPAMRTSLIRSMRTMPIWLRSA